ncbi:hypothetical protein PIB30_071687 [Stylosanthes scabra]|uniref:Uncharacterized protein n=1 Tax=Stylosanthes scabra TaxID=79078 RepID=A0ABU6RNZ9_9FABA|nr:hypothetical protein [Stylosanthes scabra]
MKRSQAGENRAPCDCTHTPSIRTGPWEHQRFASASFVHPHGPYMHPHVLVENVERNVDFCGPCDCTTPLCVRTRIEKCMGKAKEGIGSKGFMKKSLKEKKLLAKLLAAG